MLAAVVHGIDKMVLEEVPTPKPGKGELLLRVRSCAVCGSDLRILSSGNSRVNPPQVIGHEIAGEVVEVGSGVTRFGVGDRLAVGADVPCGQCYFCKAGMGNNCSINYAIGYQFPGGFAEYVVLNETTLNYGPVHRIPEGVTFDEAALAEPLACCINGLERSMIALGDKVVIIGAGPIGCMIGETAKVMGAVRTILVGRSPDRLELARELGVGADILIDSSREDLKARVLEETDGFGADVVFTACPSLDAHSQAIDIVAQRGRVNLFGGLPKGTPPLVVDSNLIHYKECYVHGSHGSVPTQHKKALDLIANGIVRTGRYITHNFPLDKVHEAFACATGRKGMKVVVNP